MATERLGYIDICRGFAILSIILAHTTGYTGELVKIRTFDVCLLVFLSGYVSSAKLSFGDYLTKRMLRLLVPVWFFLTLYFLLSYALNFISVIDYQLTLGNILGSYTLINGIGYVWVVRVFLIVSLIGYFINYFLDSKKYNMLVGLCFSLLCVYLLSFNSNSRLLYWFALEPLPYVIPFFLGVAFKRFNFGSQIEGPIIFVSFFISVLVYFLFSVDFLKYPPNLLYILYGCSVSVFIFLIFKNYIVKFAQLKALSIIGGSSMSIYLWHIPAAKYIEKSQVDYHVFWQWSLMFFSGVVLSKLIISIASYLDKKFSFNLKHWIEG